MGGIVNTGYQLKPFVWGSTKPRFQFGSASDESAFKSLTDGKSLSAGQYFGDYAVVNAGSDYIPPGYEAAGQYMAASPITNPWQALFPDKLQAPFSASLQIVKKKAAPPPAVPVTPAAPITLPTESTPTSSPSSKSTAVSSSDPPAQDFKLDEQAAAQRSYLDDTLTKRMEKFQNLLNSLTL